MSVLDIYATRSTCPRRQVACLITTAKNTIVGTGYNGVPSGLPHCLDTGLPSDHPCPGASDPSGDTSRCIAIHAEQNALLPCWRLDLALNLYVHTKPCFVCAKLIINTPIMNVFFFDDYPDLKGENLLHQAGRKLVQFERTVDAVEM
jgi:dCMP deaminase